MLQRIGLLIGCVLLLITANSQRNLYEYDANAHTRWSSPENPNGLKGAGGKLNGSAKGDAFEAIPAGKSFSLLDIKGQGIIHRIWLTLSDRSPEMLRSLKIEMFWDGESQPAVAAPLGDFFCLGLAKIAGFQNELFSTGEGRSFNCFIQMPFRKAARVVITNESSKDLPYIFYDVDYSLVDTWKEGYLYFHTYWQRDTATTLAKDFEILPTLRGRGRFLGASIGVNGNPLYKKSWFGEGEVKIYLDEDRNYPTLNGTGTEDYIGTAWGQGKFINNYTGCTLADDSLLQWAFYRFHIIDPVFFHSSIKVAMQQIGGDATANVAGYQKTGAPLIPVTVVGASNKIELLYQKGNITQIDAITSTQGWVNFYRRDDIASTAYFYSDKPGNPLPGLPGVPVRIYHLKPTN